VGRRGGLTPLRRCIEPVGGTSHGPIFQEENGLCRMQSSIVDAIYATHANGQWKQEVA